MNDAAKLLVEFAKFAAQHSAEVVKLIHAFWQTRADLGPVPPHLKAHAADVDREIDDELRRSSER
jgi:hypothetical protein